MATEVLERDIDLSEANATQGKIYEEQRAAGGPAAPYSEETVELSERILGEDLEARKARLSAELEAAEKQQQSQRQAEVPQPVPAPTPPPGDYDQAPDPEPKAVKEKEKSEEPEKSPQDILAELGLKYDPVPRKIVDADGGERTYIQKPLSFVGKIQFLSYIGEVLDKAMSGQNKLQLGSLFDVPVRGEVLSAQDFSDAETFVQAVGKLLVYAPDFLSKSYCIWLRIPEYERDWAINAMEENLSDKDGFDIIETFIDQNWETLQNFFADKLPSLSKRLQARYRVSQSEQSKH